MIRDLLFPVLYGLIIFLAGMKLLEAAMARVAGPLLRKSLNLATATPLKGLIASSLMSALLQSSTAVTVLTIGMVNAGLLTYARTLGIILGSNIGTCLTTELIGLQISSAASPLLAASLSLWAAAVIAGELPLNASRSTACRRIAEPLQFICLAVAGFALVLWGIAVMQSIGPALQSSGLFEWFLNHAATSVLWGLAAGACLTALLHSSAAVIAMAMGVAASGAMPPELGIAIVLGANIGTCVTAVLASIGGSPSGVFVAWSHVALNVGGALLFLPFTAQLHNISSWLGGGPASQIAHSQTIFNVACSVIALPLCYLPIWSRLEKRLQT
ncbi:Na/Pi cotransporter family protein [Paenibacillus sp. 19GGS1-52]|uniref:Na/Pi cotransporter family protein n=1 Tax=Paenibacillus sp. 19GGS1-52 TaxID=2758563 RepID=UPI001EFBB025|nr:Na/Pi symporter [Paenibacillus sp. 19GGS1-52]ULO10257.1 Na/Pi cotransporter family protein [Paenibacillus sp. 19GGS1-52]